MVEVIEDGESLPPGVAGRGRLTGGVAGVAEIAERRGELEAVPDFPEQADGAVEAVDGPRVGTLVLVGVAEAVPDEGFRIAVAEVAEQVQGLLAAVHGAFVVAEVGGVPAHLVERGRGGMGGPR